MGVRACVCSMAWSSVVSLALRCAGAKRKVGGVPELRKITFPALCTLRVFPPAPRIQCWSSQKRSAQVARINRSSPEAPRRFTFNIEFGGAGGGEIENQTKSKRNSFPDHRLYGPRLDARLSHALLATASEQINCMSQDLLQR